MQRRPNAGGTFTTGCYAIGRSAKGRPRPDKGETVDFEEIERQKSAAEQPGWSARVNAGATIRSSSSTPDTVSGMPRRRARTDVVAAGQDGANRLDERLRRLALCDVSAGAGHQRPPHDGRLLVHRIDHHAKAPSRPQCSATVLGRSKTATSGIPPKRAKWSTSARTNASTRSSSMS